MVTLCWLSNAWNKRHRMASELGEQLVLGSQLGRLQNARKRQGLMNAEVSWASALFVNTDQGFIRD